MLNQVTISGNYVADAEQKETSTDTTVVTARIAYNHGKDSDPEYFNITAFNKTAERLLVQGKKGEPCVISGRIRERRWEADDGGKRNAIDIVANSVYAVERYVPANASDTETDAEAETSEADAKEAVGAQF